MRLVSISGVLRFMTRMPVPFTTRMPVPFATRMPVLLASPVPILFKVTIPLKSPMSFPSRPPALVLLLGLSWTCLLAACNSAEDPARQGAAKAPLSSHPGPIGCSPVEVIDRAWYTSGKKAPLFPVLDGLSFPVSTSDPQAQRYFDQGLMLAFGFNHAEAARSFYEMTRLDPASPMGYWGFAYVLGPNYNGGMEPDNIQRALDAAVKARQLATKATPKEQALIGAMFLRYSADSLLSRASLDSSYASAMGKVYRQYPDDVTIAALYAEALMDRHPWDLWEKNGKPRPWTPQIMDILGKALKQEPAHAGVNHFYVHAAEMSGDPGMAMRSADLLRTLVPGSGHLVHMPSHTYIRTGRYHDGVLSNLSAMQVDSTYLDACHAQGVYPLAYYPHNAHFMAACATLSGESEIALRAAWSTAGHVAKELLPDPAWSTLQHYYTIPLYVEVKLGRWSQVDSAAEPDQALTYPRVIWHYAKGMAALHANRTGAAEQHLRMIMQLMEDSTLAKRSIWGINSLFDLSAIAYQTLQGEIYARSHQYPLAITALMQAVSLEDKLNYNEPPDWFFSVRHHLGAVYQEAGMFRESIAIYREDLETYPENGWALKGLMNAYQELGMTRERYAVTHRFRKAWAFSDLQINSSRLL